MEDTALYHLELAQGHWDGGEVPAAIEECQFALALDPQLAEAHFLLAFIFSGRNLLPQAVQHYRQALLLRPDHHEITNNLGVVFLQLERWEEAEELFMQLTEIPSYATPGHAYNNLGWARFKQDRIREALADFEMATYLQPDLCLAYNNQGLALIELERFDDATDILSRCIERCARYPEPRYHLGRIYHGTGRYTEAETLFEECVEMGPYTDLGRRCTEYLDVYQPSARR